MRKKKKNELPGGVKFTPALRHMQKTNYLRFIKEYQQLLLQTAKVYS